MRRLGQAWLGLTLVFLYAPIAVMAAMSFNASEFYALPFRFSTEWYGRLWRNEAILAASWRSVWIALVVTGIATLLGTAAALADLGGRTIVLVGALAPARFAESDAAFNLGMAFACAQAAREGVYITMNGTVWPAGAVMKDRSVGAFVPKG